ncbi:hypothetical protein BsWGS_13782 [Bradybaena similaris]
MAWTIRRSDSTGQIMPFIVSSTSRWQTGLTVASVWILNVIECIPEVRQFLNGLVSTAHRHSAKAHQDNVAPSPGLHIRTMLHHHQVYTSGQCCTITRFTHQANVAPSPGLHIRTMLHHHHVFPTRDKKQIVQLKMCPTVTTLFIPSEDSTHPQLVRS